MRTRRGQLGLTGVDLAQKAGISPSYVSLIEKGAKVPDEDVAARLARALDDDEGLYRAWARAARLGLHDLDLLYRLERIARTPAYVNLVERGEALPQLAPPVLPASQDGGGPELRSRMREVASRLVTPPAASRPTIARDAHSPDPGPQPAASLGTNGPPESAITQVPLLADGAVPGQNPTPAPQRHLILDSRLFDERQPQGLFAYTVTARAMKHLRGVAAPGDRIVFLAGGRVTPDRICAVRTHRGIVLARVLFKGRSLLLLPGEGERDFETVEVDEPELLPKVIVGTHVLLIRR